MVVVFDLDDTLFDERSFLLSGFRVVAQYLGKKYDLEKNLVYCELQQELAMNRNEVFNRFLVKKGLFTQKLVKECLSVYRRHKPNIHLFPDADDCLKRFKGFPLYVVTDGNKIVQMNKFLALGLEDRVKKCICTSAYGLEHAKPSPYCFLKICEWERMSPKDVVYIADNPKKDFVGIKSLGFKTIRLLRGAYKNLVVIPQYEADEKVTSLDEVSREKIDFMSLYES